MSLRLLGSDWKLYIEKYVMNKIKELKSRI